MHKMHILLISEECIHFDSHSESVFFSSLIVAKDMQTKEGQKWTLYMFGKIVELNLPGKCYNYSAKLIVFPTFSRISQLC